jgi:hypothetical protein
MMSNMNPFDQPPTEPPVSLDPPSVAGRSGADGPRRGRMALAALAAAGLVGGGIVVAGQFASADEQPSLGAAAVDEPAPDETDDVPTVNDNDADEDDTESDGEIGDMPTIDGEIVIDDGDGDPFVLDLGELGECIGPILRGGPMFDPDGGWDGEGRSPLPFDDEFHQRMEEFLEDLPWDELGDFGIDDDGVRIFGSGGSMITVVGPDGVEVIDLGDGDATVTIEQTDGELTIETEGDATVSELPDIGELLPDLGEMDLGELDLGELEDRDLSGLLPFDLDEIESCLDDLND